MKLKVIAKNDIGENVDLSLTKEKKIVHNGDIFEIDDLERAKEILNTKFCGNPVVEEIKEPDLTTKKCKKN